MDQVVQAFGQYLADKAGVDVTVTPRPPEGLPAFLRERYDLCRMQIAGRDVAGVVVRDPTTLSPAAFEKHLRQLPADVQQRYVVVAEDLPGYVRNRLVERRIPFVVPGTQANWPELGVIMRARRDHRPVAVGPRLSPATQAVLVGALAGALPHEFAAKEAAELLAYTRMTMTRVFDELEAAGLAKTRRHGHERRLRFNQTGKALWDTARSMLRDPVRKTVRLRTEDVAGAHAPLAGESALAETTMLAAPQTPVYAIGPEGWAAIRNARPEVLPVEDAGTCLLQVWAYDPSIAGRDGRVDPFSLLLTLEGNDDERVALALDEMMEDVRW